MRRDRQPIPEETVSVGNCPSKPMRALVAKLLGNDQPVQRRGRGRPFRIAGDAPAAEQAERNAAWLLGYLLKAWRRQHGHEPAVALHDPRRTVSTMMHDRLGVPPRTSSRQCSTTSADTRPAWPAPTT